ncbi:MAG: hypothetical protein WBK91_07735 [Alphaproteobacteria bacterium]
MPDHITWPLFLIGGLGLALLLVWIWLRRNHAQPGRWTRFGFWTCQAALGGLSLWFSWWLGSPIYFLIFAAMIFPLLRLWQDAAVQAVTPEHTATRTGRISVLQSPWLILHIDHDSGACSGQMLRGTLRDWQLHEMDGHDLQQTRTEILAADPVGSALLDFWLDRHGPLHWRKDFDVNAAAPAAEMPRPTRDESATMLGLDLKASKPDIETAAARLHTIMGKDPRHSHITAWISAAHDVLIH